MSEENVLLNLLYVENKFGYAIFVEMEKMKTSEEDDLCRKMEIFSATTTKNDMTCK